MSFIAFQIENYNIKTTYDKFTVYKFSLKNLTVDHIKFATENKRREILLELNIRLLTALKIHNNDKATIISIPYSYDDITSKHIFEYAALDNYNLIWGFQEEQ